MNDRLGSSDTDIDKGNIRYYGANPNNYIYFNCDTYPSTNCETWRIIGVTTDRKVKIVIDTSIGERIWDSTGGGGWGTNNWETASLKTNLNGAYLNGNGSYTGTKGIKTDETREMIENATWYLGGPSTADGVYSNQWYQLKEFQLIS